MGMLAFVAAVALLPAPGGEAFADLEHDAAVERAREQGRLLLLDFTAVWCGPCKRMDASTWVDEQVLDWLDEHAVAIQVDVDEQPAVAGRYRVSAMPTVVVVRDGEELDRVIGYRDAEQLLGWLDGVLEGRNALDRVRAEAEADPTSVRARRDLAESLVHAGRYDESLEEYLWLWEHMLEHDPSMVGVRSSFMLGDIEELVARHPPAREAFARVYADDQRAVEAGTADARTWDDWIELGRMLGEEQALLDWLERQRTPEGRLDVPVVVADEFAELLLERGRIAEAGALFTQPVARAANRVRSLEKLRAFESRYGDSDAEERASLDAMLETSTRRELERLHAALLAAGRHSDATGVAEVLVDAMPKAPVVLDAARRALDHDGMTRDYLRWLAALVGADHVATSDQEAAAELAQRVHDALGAAPARDDLREVAPPRDG